jgi:hypothetical protein
MLTKERKIQLLCPHSFFHGRCVAMNRAADCVAAIGQASEVKYEKTRSERGWLSPKI